MLTIRPVSPENKALVRQFVQQPFEQYRGNPYWVPPIRSDVYAMLHPGKHPFYEHSTAAFWLAERNGKAVGRIAALENRAYNRYHATKQGQFYLFESEDNPETAAALFEQVIQWARRNHLNTLIGPKGFGPLDGYGILIEGFEQRQMMNMMNYNPPYYPSLLESLGFTKEVDFVSCYLSAETFHLPERIARIVERVRQRSGLQVKRFASKRELLGWQKKIGQAYNQAFVNNWEYYPLTEREIEFVVQNILLIADHRLIKIITHQERVVGFLFAFPDISAAMQKINGNLNPISILRLLYEMKRTKWIALNGAGILPEFQGRGGNALLYAEMVDTVRQFGFQHADLTQVADTATQMRADLENLGGKIYKTHRVYRLAL